MDPKYEFTGKTRICRGVTMHQIRAVQSFGAVKAGDIGGWIESEQNLSHNGACWVSEYATVLGDAQVSHDAYISGSAIICEKARIMHRAKVMESACVDGCAIVMDNALIQGNAYIGEKARIINRARVMESAFIGGYAIVMGHALIQGSAHVLDNTYIGGYAIIDGRAIIYENEHIDLDALITKKSDIFSISHIESMVDKTTFFRCQDGSVKLTCGCFKGTIEEFLDKVKKTHKDNKYAQMYRKAVEMARIHFDIS